MGPGALMAQGYGSSANRSSASAGVPADSFAPGHYVANMFDPPIHLVIKGVDERGFVQGGMSGINDLGTGPYNWAYEFNVLDPKINAEAYIGRDNVGSVLVIKTPVGSIYQLRDKGNCLAGPYLSGMSSRSYPQIPFCRTPTG